MMMTTTMRSLPWMVLLLVMATTVRAQTVHAPALPARVGAYQLVDTRIFADTLLGTWYRFTAGRASALDVMVQPPRGADARTRTADEAITAAVRSFKLVQMQRAGGSPVRVVVDRADTLRIGSRVAPGWLVQVSGGADPERTSLLRVYHLGERYVRIVGAVPGASMAQTADFAQRLLPVLITAWGL